MQTLIQRLKKIPKKYVFETLITLGGLIVLAVIVSLITPTSTKTEYAFYEQDTSQSPTLFRAEVITINKTSIDVQLKDGPNNGSTIEVPFKNPDQKAGLRIGTTVIISEYEQKEDLLFYDIYRLHFLIIAVGIFIAVVLLIGRRRGLMSLAGLGASILVIGWIIVPLVVAGYNSLLVSVFGAYLIAIVSIIIAHGFKTRTFISLLCVLIILIFVTVASQLAVYLLGLSGIIDEAGYYLKIDHPEIDLSGILVGGIVIAALGALDDIVTTQVATVDELKKTKPSLTVAELYKKAFSVGSEHIAALVNTLALVYVGAALPLIVLYAVSTPELFKLFNSEFVATEIIRTVLVSLGLVIAVPVSTYISAVLIHRNHEKKINN